ncbi:ATP-dependent transcriptional regulator [Desulfosporosinus orientis DSM 765]|uniref:ATP-dependent transcriptional regulator n=1 Tax=Desulfosporosinus orientis (strain ATCC 19365 / DSM 765 / NCIMB 8382 / VKM B-1628 / Singapore I) TaxID=768706 RepID=G7WG95_DESOD|nr:LuxR C-terminal-related transcriptional regulator [Desulfosporosinus orientis]AET70827.1 ATP-dependent transcriptional regulator [Desulfosporosinus orientis DSM 765]
MSIAKRYNQKALFFSVILKERFERIFEYPLTIVEAPMGYGKTTAVREFLNNTGANVLWQRVYGSSLDSFWHGFSRLFAELDDFLSRNLEQLGFPDDSISRLEALRLIEDLEMTVKTVLVIDDYHLIDNFLVNSFIEFLVESEVANLHVILTARYTELQGLDELKLKGYLYHITKQTFELMPKDIAGYYRLCGIRLKTFEAEELYSLTEGWISALYLLMLNYIEEGSFRTITNIYNLVEKAVYAPFAEEVKAFLLTLCLFDSFTLEQAIHMWQKENAGLILTEITNKNAFVKYDHKTKTYQMHNIFTNFLKDKLEGKSVKQQIQWRAAQWYLKEGNYFASMHYFYACKDFDQLLFALENNKANGVNNANRRELFIKYFKECPDDVKSKHHFALLIFALSFIIYREPVLFEKACREFIGNIQKDDSLNNEFRQRLLGEYELLLSFTGYNDINKMSEHHQKAAKLLHEPTSFIDLQANWTYGAPSVLHMFYRESGRLEKHVHDIIEALPYYYQITNGHGSGAEYVMEAERYFNMGDFINAEIVMHKALNNARTNNQTGIVICALFLQIRLSIWKGDYATVLDLFQVMHESISDLGQSNFNHTINICEGYVYSLLKQRDKIPSWIGSGDFSSSRLLFPTVPMLNIVYGRVLLIDGEYLRLIGNAEHFIGLASVFPNLLGQIYTYIYLTAANGQIFRTDEAIFALIEALAIAMPDKVYMPFVENCDYIKPFLEQLYNQGKYGEDIIRILELYKTYQKSVECMIKENFSAEEKPDLTERETQIAQLAADGLSNKEIGERLYISINTVKTQLKSIFEKLGVNSRALLKQEFKEKL